MATDSAPLRSPTSAQNLWQIPVFLLGAASLVGVWYARPYLQPSPGEKIQNDLATLKQVLEKSPFDRKQLQPAVQKVQANLSMDQVDPAAAFLIGTAHVNLAESSIAEEETKKAWTSARSYLEKAREGKLGDTEISKLNFRLGKAWAATGETETSKIIDAIGKNLLCGDDPAEGYRLLAGEYLKTTPPDPRRARDLYKEYLSRAMPRTDPKVLNRSRLELGKLQTQLGDVEEARKVLSRINEDASVDVYIASRIQLAKGHSAEQDWPGAIQSLDEARKARGISAAQLASIEYPLASTYLKVGRTADAITLLDKLRKNTGEEGQAANLRLAEFMVKDAKNRDVSASYIDAALSKLRTPDEYRNSHVPLSEARAIVESIATTYRIDAEFPLSLSTIKSGSRILEPGRDRELAAETFEAWGDALQRQARTDDPEAEKWKKAAQSKFRDGAIELESLLLDKKSVSPTEKAKIGNDLVRLLTRAGDQEKARAVLQEIRGTDTVQIPMPMVPPLVESKDTDWLQKGEIALAAGDKTKAIEAFEQGSNQQGPSQFRCRYQLARLLIDGGTPDLIERGTKLLEGIDGPEAEKDRETHEAAAYLLGSSLYQRADWIKAEFRLGRALQFYPEGIQATKGRFQQAYCFWYSASQRASKIRDLNVKVAELDSSVSGRGGSPTEAENRQKKSLQDQIDNEEKEYRQHLSKARPLFQDVEDRLMKKLLAAPLPAEEQKFLYQSGFRTADCSFYLGDYEDCVRRYEGLGDRYRGKVEELRALSQLWQCYNTYLEDPKKAEYVLSRMQTAFQKLKDSDFDESFQDRSRKFWEKWFAQIDGK